MNNLYDQDVLLWSEQQGALLRRRAAGELVNEQSLDWANIAEEIESVGREQLHAVISHLRLALLHDLKAQAWPSSRDVPHWRAEARSHRGEALDRYTPSMAQKIDIEKLYRRARHGMPTSVDGVAPLPTPDACPMTLAELIREEQP